MAFKPIRIDFGARKVDRLVSMTLGILSCSADPVGLCHLSQFEMNSCIKSYLLKCRVQKTSKANKCITGNSKTNKLKKKP